jgi:hypothetical protein
MIQAKAKIAHMINGKLTHCTVVAMTGAMKVLSFRRQTVAW